MEREWVRTPRPAFVGSIPRHQNMADDSNTDKVASAASDALENVQDTKGIYVALALLFVANAAGVFSASIPSIIFVVLFLVAVGIDAYA